MSQESVSLSAESVQQQQTYPETVEHIQVDSDDHEGSSHSAEQFGIGLSAGILIGGILGVAVDLVVPGDLLGLAVLFGVIFGVVAGLYTMEVR
jgi:hypothetical protein